MKKQFLGFISGIICTVILFATVPALGASLKTISVNLNAVNIEVDGKKVASAGEDYTLDNGSKTAGSISYNGTTYIPVRRIGELLSTKIGWNQKTQSVLIGESATDPDITAPSTDDYELIEVKYVSHANKIYSISDHLSGDSFTLYIVGEKTYVPFFPNSEDITNDFVSLLGLADLRWNVNNSANPYLDGVITFERMNYVYWADGIMKKHKAFSSLSDFITYADYTYNQKTIYDPSGENAERNNNSIEFLFIAGNTCIEINSALKYWEAQTQISLSRAGLECIINLIG